MATITLWPRLIALIDKEYRATIDDAKSTFDFMIHCSLLSLVLALAELFLGLFNSLGRFTSPGQTLAWIGTIAAFSFLSYLFYRLSISRAIAWGNLFRGAFDLYRWDLLQKMGYGPAPKVRAAERALWDKISTQVIYGDRPVSGPWVDYEEPATHARGAPENAPLEVTRGVLPTKKDGSITILLEVSNPNGKTVKQVVLSDRLPDGYDYEWDSAQLDGTSTRLTGTNPYRFIVGDLAPGEKTQLCYRAVRMVENK